MTSPHALPLRFALVCLAATLLSSTALAGSQWKWRDDNGNTQYSDRPPPFGTPEASILTRPTASRAAVKVAEAASAAASTPLASSAASSKAPETELDVKRRRSDEERQAKQKLEEDKQAKLRADNCQRARAYMKTLSDGMRVARTNAAGEREIIDDKGRSEETQRTQEVIQANCK